MRSYITFWELYRSLTQNCWLCQTGWSWIHVYANWTTPVQSFRQKVVANGSKAAATPYSSRTEESCRAQFINRTTRSNWAGSRMARLPPTCWFNSVQRAKRASFVFNARRTAEKLFLASEILLSKIQLMQLRSTSSRLAELVKRCLESWSPVSGGPMGTNRAGNDLPTAWIIP